MRKCFAILAVLILTGVVYGVPIGEATKDIFASKISTAGGINTMQEKQYKEVQAWSVNTKKDYIAPIMQEVVDKTLLMNDDQKKKAKFWTTQISNRYAAVVKFEAALSYWKTESANAVTAASVAFSVGDIPTVVTTLKDASKAQKHFSFWYGEAVIDSAKCGSYIGDLEKMLKDIPYPMNMSDQ